VHWGIPDPAAVTENEVKQREAFMQAYTTLERRIRLFLALPIEYLKPDQTLKYLKEIGEPSP
jgi:arsenate reductase